MRGTVQKKRCAGGNFANYVVMWFFLARSDAVSSKWTHVIYLVKPLVKLSVKLRNFLA